MGDQPPTRVRSQARKPLSKRRRLEELQQEEAQYRAIFENTAIGIILADAKGRPHKCNSALERILGYTADELRAMRLSDFTHPDDSEEIERALQALLKGGLEHVHTEKRYIRKDGSLVWVNVIASTVLNTDGELGLSIAMIEDISARKSAEADTEVAVSARKSAEADTEVAKDYATDLIETTGAMVVGLDLNGDVRLFNKAAEEITGYTREELAGRNWFEVVVPRERYPAVWEEFERLLAGGLPRRFESPILTKSGDERYIVWRNTEVGESDSATGMASIGIDVTERKHEEENLRRMATVVRDSNDAITIQDFEGRITAWNRGAELIYGYSEEEAFKMNMGRLTSPGKVEEQRDFTRRLLAGEEITSFETQRVTKDGRVLDVWMTVTKLMDDAENPIGIASTERDITERKRTEEALRHERDLVAKIINTSPIGIVAHNRQDEITFANAEAERILGLTRDEARHRYKAPGWPITDDKGRPFSNEELPFRRVVETGHPVYDVRYAIENASGERVYLSVNAAPTLGENGEPDGMIASIDDISKLTRAEATRELLEAELLHSQKMEAVGKLATGVAHNFNNLLTAITGYGELLLAKLPADSDLRPDVEEIGRAGERAAEVARGLLRFSRRGREYRERLDLNSVITEMETLLRQVIRSNIEITTVLADGLDRVRNNQSLIEQVIVNLIVNASDAMPDGGKLTIETANLHLAEPRLVRNLSLPAGSYVTLAVRDSGIGMNEEMQARLFEPFYTTKGPDQGTGLGLSTVYGIIEESEGAILVESAPGQGSTFTIFLPSIPDQRLRT